MRPTCIQRYSLLPAIGITIYFLFRLSWLNQTMVHVDDFVPLAEQLRQQANPWYLPDILTLSCSYTYPPGQFFISLPLASLTSDFSKALLFYRLPSLIIWSVGLYTLYRLIRILWPELPRISAALPVILGLVSWRGFIESSQGYNYATTTLVAVCTAWFVVSDCGRKWIAGKASHAILGGLLLGSLTWLTYQALFVVAAGLAALFLHNLIQRNYRAMCHVCVAGIGFLIPFGAIYGLCLRKVLSFASGIPSWANSFAPNATATGKLLFPITAWFEVLQNNLTFLPWGLGSSFVAITFGILIAGGTILVLIRPEKRQRNQPLILFLLCIFLIFTVGPYLRLFTLGASRHSFVLQVPLLLALGLALTQYHFPIRVGVITIFTMLVLWLVALPNLLSGIQNRVDYKLIERTFTQWPDTRISDLPGGFSWEITFLAKADHSRLERIRWYLQFSKTPDLAAWLMESKHALMVSHRAPMDDYTRTELLAAGAKSISTLAAIAPGRGTELSGPINGGNGFYLYLIER